MTATPVLVPLLNANEPEARLIQIHVEDGQYVEAGAVLFTMETTKAAADVEAPASGFVRLLAREGETFAVGDRLAVLTATAEEPLEAPAASPSVSPPSDASSPASSALRITNPARALAAQLGVDLSRLPTDKLITEAIVRQYAGAAPTPAAASSAPASAEIVIYGGGGHAKTVMEMVQAIGAFRIAGIIDDGIPAGTEILGFRVLGGREALPGLVEQGIRLAANGVGGIIDINVRVRLFELMTAHGFAFPILAHPRAMVERSARLGDGVQVFANAYIGSSAVVHPRAMINTGAVVSHDCEIGSYTHIAPGALLAGHVHVGERALVGMGVTTAIGVKIGSHVRIGNGAVIYADVPDKTIIPAGKVWDGK
ncbi:MAG: NeuD/PglB/VioB family sugar acetyltransferase [Anaerolineales bacterium]